METRRDWELQTRVKTLKTYADLKTFIKQRVIALEAASMNPVSVVNKKHLKSPVLVATLLPSSPNCSGTDTLHQRIGFKKRLPSQIEQLLSKVSGNDSVVLAQ